MNTDTLHDTFKDLESDARALDPDRVLAGARRRRRRRTALTGVASLGVAAVTVTSFALAGAIGPGDDAPVAGQAAVVADPPPIGDNTWYRLSKTRWIRTTKAAVQLADKPGPAEWTGFTDWRNEASLARGWSGPMGDQGPWETVAALRQDAHRVVVQVDVGGQVTRHEAQVYRLASVPGWRLAYVEYPVDPRASGGPVSIAVDAYAADGSRLMHCDPRPFTHGAKDLPDGACTAG